jgi:hypothetical protein
MSNIAISLVISIPFSVMAFFGIFGLLTLKPSEKLGRLGSFSMEKTLKGRLPPEQRRATKGLLREKPDEYAGGHNAFLSRRIIWGRLKGFLGA